MTSREIIDLKKIVVRALSNRQLKDAFEGLIKLTINTHDWRLSQQVNELEVNYKYMLHYLFEGVKDPEREKVYNNLLRSLYEIVDDAADELLKQESSNLFFERLRIYELKTTTLSDYLNQLKDIVMSISLTGLMEGDVVAQKRDLAIRRERLASEMFNRVFVSSRTDKKTIEDYYNFITSVDLSVREKCLFISALTLNLFHRFDALKIQVLMKATESDQVAVRARAMVSLVVVMQMYDVRWSLYPELGDRMAVLAEDVKFRKSIERVVIQLIRSRETEKISQKIKNEILPEMMKFSHRAGKKLNMEDLMGETEFAEKNPEWQKELEDSGLSKKLQEYSSLQMEGADVFHSTFASLKNYPFFSEMSNWFMPFDPSYSDLMPLFLSDNKNNILHAAIVDSGHMCNSDKYSFCLSLLQISAGQREMMLGQMNAESEQVKQMHKDAAGVNPSIDEEIVSNQYIQDLYRFFKLSSHRNSFFDIFQLSIDFYSKKSIAPLISDVDGMRKIGLYCFEKNYLQEALEIFLKLTETSTVDDNLWQKIAYCQQMLENLGEALRSYLKADLITPNNSWILRHIAQLYRRMGEYDKAIQYYQKAAKITPGNLGLELNIGHCYLEKKDYENALNSYFKIEMLDSNNDRALRPIAWTSFLERKYEQSQRYYSCILDRKPTIHDYLNAGHTELCMNNRKKALELYRHAVELESMNSFMDIFEGDIDTLLEHGVEEPFISFLIDQLKYSAS